METPAGGGVRPLSTVLHTLDLLRNLAESERPLRLSEIAQRNALSRPTAYQRLLTLVEAGFLEVDDDQRYRLSLFAAQLAQAAMQQAGIGPRTEPVMAELMRTTGETVSLAMLEQSGVRIVARVETNMLLRVDQKVGSQLDLAGSASGRVLCAFASAHELALLKDAGQPLPEAAVLGKTRAEGYALSSGYSLSGVVGIAAPVFGPGQRCLAALSLVVPEKRYELEPILAPLKAAAERLSTIFKGGKA